MNQTLHLKRVAKILSNLFPEPNSNIIDNQSHSPDNWSIDEYKATVDTN